MGFSAQDIRENYERTETEVLLSYAGKDLTDAAREILDEVLKARGLSTGVIKEVRSQAVEAQKTEIENEEKLATIPSRLVAFAIDFFGMALAIGVVLLPVKIFSESTYIPTGLVVFWTYFLFRDGLPGQGVGKRLMSIRTVQLAGKRATFSNSFWRNLTHFFFVIDALFALGKRRMRFGDMLAETHAIRAQESVVETGTVEPASAASPTVE
jgi:uncharacterized RDD family membrane protein YckC